MTIAVSEGVALDIQINGTDLPPMQNVFKSLELHSGIGFPIPVGTITFNDMHGLLSAGEFNLVDGTKISLKLQYLDTGEDSTDESIEIEAIVFGKVKTEPTSQGYIRKATIIPDLPQFIVEAQREFYEGTSHDAISAILQQHGVEVDAGELALDDSMTWRNVGRTQANFVQEILSKSYNGESTCVKGALDWGNVFYLRDLFTVLQEEADCTMYNISLIEKKDTNVFLREVDNDTSSGFFNKLTNYGHTHVQHSLTGESIVLEEANPPELGSGLPINLDIQSGIDLTALTAGRWFDSGTSVLGAFNVHKYYYDAAYLNMRHLSLFTETVRGLTDNYYNLPLLKGIDYIHGEHSEDQNSTNSAYSGNYLIGNKTIVVRENHYAEVYTLYRSYITEPGSTPLISADTAAAVVGKVTDKVESAVDKAVTEAKLATQTNPNIKSITKEVSEAEELAKELGEFDPDSVDPSSALDSFNAWVDEQTQKVADMLDEFMEEGKAWANENIIEKYGEEIDYLEAAGKEFQSALKKLDDLCDSLIPSELAAINLLGPNLGDVIGVLGNRVGKIERLSSQMNSDLNSLIRNNGIPDTYLNNPKLATACSQLKEALMDNVDTNDLPNKCLDKVAMAALNLPSSTLAKKLRLLENMINDMLCAHGEGATANATLNGPGKQGITLGDVGQ